MPPDLQAKAAGANEIERLLAQPMEEIARQFDHAAKEMKK